MEYVKRVNNSAMPSNESRPYSATSRKIGAQVMTLLLCACSGTPTNTNKSNIETSAIRLLEGWHCNQDSYQCKQSLIKEECIRNGFTTSPTKKQIVQARDITRNVSSSIEYSVVVKEEMRLEQENGLVITKLIPRSKTYSTRISGWCTGTEYIIRQD